MHFRRALVLLFFAYTFAGSLLGVITYAAFVLIAVAFGEPGALSDGGLSLDSFSGIIILWVIGLVPAGIASLSLCVVMALWPTVYENRKSRVLIAAIIGAIATSLVFMGIGVFGIGIGALSATLLAYRWPRSDSAHAAMREIGSATANGVEIVVGSKESQP